jgi:hypothetical protein
MYGLWDINLYPKSPCPLTHQYRFTEIINSSSYAILGIPAAISVSATLLARVVTLWFKLVVSYVVFQWAGIELLLGKSQETATSLTSVSSRIHS